MPAEVRRLHPSIRHIGKHAIVGTIAVTALTLGIPHRADAHFVLQQPASWMSQDSLGSPQKLGPCGDESGGTATAAVTAFQSGQTITVTIDEVIFHPGHYRIALATNDRSELPPEPPVTAGSTPCGSVPIQTPPVFPVLADGVFAHTSPFNGPQTVQVTLPANVTCTKCTLQVIEFMSNHPLNNPGGCFYHHCADISIQTAPVLDGGTTIEDAGAPKQDASTPASAADGGDESAAGDGGASGGASPQDSGSPQNGCSCRAPGAAPVGRAGGSLFALAVVMQMLRRRRRRESNTAS